MKTAFSCLIILSACVPVLADDFTTTDGKKFEGVTVKRVEADGIMVMTDSGIAKIFFTKLPEDIQKKYGFDPAKAAQFQQQMRNAAAPPIEKNKAGFCDYKIEHIFKTELKATDLTDLEVLKTVPTSFNLKTITCLVIITGIREGDSVFDLTVTDQAGKEVIGVPFVVDRFVDKSETQFILDLMKSKTKQIVLTGKMIPYSSSSDKPSFSCRRFRLVND